MERCPTLHHHHCQDHASHRSDRSEDLLHHLSFRGSPTSNCVLSKLKNKLNSCSHAHRHCRDPLTYVPQCPYSHLVPEHLKYFCESNAAIISFSDWLSSLCCTPVSNFVHSKILISLQSLFTTFSESHREQLLNLYLGIMIFTL
eukprot:Filipodium_phascolosomae@DN1598_c0_g1_i4.p1